MEKAQCWLRQTSKMPFVCFLYMWRISMNVLTMSWKGEVYIDHCIPFGLRSAPKLFNILADLLLWAAQKARVSYLIHYLGNYLTIGPPLAQVCQCNVDIFTSLCKDLAVPLTKIN